MEESELRQLLDALHEVLAKRRGLGRTSRWALHTAITAAEHGVEATLIMKIPKEGGTRADRAERIDIELHPGPVEVTYLKNRALAMAEPQREEVY